METQKSISKKCGISQPYLSNILRGNRNARLPLAKKLSKLFRVKDFTIFMDPEYKLERQIAYRNFKKGRLQS